MHTSSYCDSPEVLSLASGGYHPRCVITPLQTPRFVSGFINKFACERQSEENTTINQSITGSDGISLMQLTMDVLELVRTEMQGKHKWEIEHNNQHKWFILRSLYNTRIDGRNGSHYKHSEAVQKMSVDM